MEFIPTPIAQHQPCCIVGRLSYIRHRTDMIIPQKPIQGLRSHIYRRPPRCVTYDRRTEPNTHHHGTRRRKRERREKNYTKEKQNKHKTLGL